MSVNRSSRRRFVITIGAGALGVAASAIVVACGGAPAAPTSVPAAAKPAVPQGGNPEPTKPASGAGPTHAPAASGAAPTQAPAASGASAPTAAAKPAAGGAKTTITFSHYLDPAAAKVYESIVANEWREEVPEHRRQDRHLAQDQFTGKMLDRSAAATTPTSPWSPTATCRTSPCATS